MKENQLPSMGMLIMRSWPDVIAAVWILILSIVLFCNLNNTPLWQDEAESALNSLTISWKSPIPRGAPNGEPALLHEMALYYKTDDPKYEYLPTHFMYTPYVTIHGWVPYYFIRAGIDIFGKNNFGPRVFSVIFFSFALAVLYVLVRAYSGPIPSLMTIICFTVTPIVLEHAIQARYYSYMLFISMATAFFFMRFLTEQSARNLSFLIVCVTILYYTYQSLFVLYHLIFISTILILKPEVFRKYVVVLFISSIFIIPHMVFTKFPLLVMNIPARHSVDMHAFAWFLYSFGSNVSMLLCSIIILVLIARKLLRRDLASSRDQLDFLSILMVVVGFVFISFTAPHSSFYPRIFLPLVPFLVYAAVSMLDRLKLRTAHFFLLATVLFIGFPLTIFPEKSDKLKTLITGSFKHTSWVTNTLWVKDVLQYIDEKRVDSPLILTSFEHFVFRYYSDYESELIWPLRKEFIDYTDRHLFIIAEGDKDLRLHCEIFLPNELESCQQIETMKIFDRIQECCDTDISGVRVFECPPKTY